MDSILLKSFLEIPYDELESLNLQSKHNRLHITPQKAKDYYLNYLEKEKRLKAVTLGFTDLEGRFHMIDYDKKFFIRSYDNLTFDGSSIRGFSRQAESDLRLVPDWQAFWWLPSDVFGAGKVLMMGDILDRDSKEYEMDTRTMLKKYLAGLKKKSFIVQISNEIEGFLMEGTDAEKKFDETKGFIPASRGGYYHSLPNETLRNFIDTTAETQRALGFENEKDHLEVAPSQFELNYSYSEALIAADQVQLYKLTARQIARNMGMTATFLPKPITGINGNGMHTNLSVLSNGKNNFYDKKGQAQLSDSAWQFIDRILYQASALSLILNSSVNAYRRLDPHFEAPNEIKVSEIDRGAMIRIPLHNEKSARIEIRSVAPDINPYLATYCLIRTGFESESGRKQIQKRPRVSFFPSSIQNAIIQFRQSDWTSKLLGEEFKKRYINLKETQAMRCPESLGTKVKNPEVLFHHEVYNQLLWNDF